MEKNLLIVFAKNITEGKVKTRLAASIGSKGALQVYRTLFDITEKQSTAVSNCQIHIYFSHEIIDNAWPDAHKFVQCSGNLGAKMTDAFQAGIAAGYDKIIGIGADLADLSSEIIEEAFDRLVTHDFVFGPAEDGGYYLVGTSQKKLYIFENKPWSTSTLLKETLVEIEQNRHTVSFLETKNDIDTIEDLKKSRLAEKYQCYY